VGRGEFSVGLAAISFFIFHQNVDNLLVVEAVICLVSRGKIVSHMLYVELVVVASPPTQNQLVIISSMYVQPLVSIK
jgi:hypothetical protein